MTSQPAGLTVHLEGVLPAPPSLVFRALTDPPELAKWWGPHGFTCPGLDLDLRVGGGYRIAMQPPEGDLFYLQGEFREVDPPHRLAYTFRWEDPDPDDVETIVTLSLRDLGGSTELTLDQGAFATEPRRALHEQGWTDCFERLRGLMSESLSAERLLISGHGGDEVEAYLARPADDGSRGGVVVIHHAPGYDRATKEIVRRFAELGYDAICPNLYWREAPGAAPADAYATARAQGWIPDERLIGDVAGAARYLRSLPTSNGKVGVIGYCSGGRQAVLAACNLDVDAAVDCYGAFVVGTPPADFPLPVTNLVDQLPGLRAPLLGLFGKEDTHPSPEQVAELDEILTANGKPHEFHSYDDAGHAFFAVDRPSYRVAAANDGWERIAAFYATHLGG